MKFSLVFDNSGDSLPFEVKHNHELFEFFVDQANTHTQNSFSNDRELYNDLDKKITHLHWAISKTNEVLYDLVGKSFEQHTDLENYLDQRFLNKQHSDWVFSHRHDIDIDKLRFSSNLSQARLGNLLHELYPDEIRLIKTAPAMEKLGYIYPFREVNIGIHDLESSFVNMEFKADNKWEVFENPFRDTMISSNDIVNFSFGYTYVGRQYYNKFKCSFDINQHNEETLAELVEKYYNDMDLNDVEAGIPCVANQLYYVLSDSRLAASEDNPGAASFPGIFEVFYNLCGSLVA